MNVQAIPRATAVALLVLAGAGLTAQEQRPVFRSRADAVAVNAAVRRGNVPALGLQPADFRLLDNGVVQTVTWLDYEAVPIDVTLFLDTSPSLSGLLEELKRDMAKIAAMLRPGDRLRLLTFGYQVDDVFGWRPAGADLPVEEARVGRLSSVSDAILLALLHRPQVDRRHLVIAMTDAMDAGSQVEMSQLRAVSARSEAVLHVMVMPSAYSPPPNMPGGWGVGVPELVSAPLTEVAERTGGRLHSATFGRVSVVNGFSQAFEDFRQSYVLHYTPTGVARVGWHEIEVHVPAEPRLTIRARKGYFGS